MFEELDIVVLDREIKEYGLKAGDVGTVVHLYNDSEAVEVEFLNSEGKTIALLTLSLSDLRPMETDEILHAREVVTA